jgi:MFS family permease
MKHGFKLKRRSVQGWDQTGSNAANLSFPVEFGIGSGVGADSWKVGAINSIIYLVGGGIGCWLSDPFNSWFGRRGEIFISAVILFVTPIGSACSQSWQGLFAARFVMGIGLGMKNACVAVYSSEMAPARVRGALVMFWQLWVTFGMSRISASLPRHHADTLEASSLATRPTASSRMPAGLRGAFRSARPSSPPSL